MTQRNIINAAGVHLANISIRLKSKTFFVKHTFESGRDLPEARDLYFPTRCRSPQTHTPREMRTEKLTSGKLIREHILFASARGGERALFLQGLEIQADQGHHSDGLPTAGLRELHGMQREPLQLGSVHQGGV